MENISNNKCEFISVVEGFRNYIFNEKPYFMVLEHSGAIMTFCNQNFVEKASKMLAYLSQLMVNESLVNWFCPMCGYKNDGRFCPKCGTPKPII